MLEGLPNIPGLGGIMKKAQEMQRQMQELRERLKAETVTASVGGDLVKATVNGEGSLVRIEIDPSAVNADEKDMLEDLVVAAVNQAGEKARERYREEMRRLTGGVDVAGMFGLS